LNAACTIDISRHVGIEATSTFDSPLFEHESHLDSFRDKAISKFDNVHAITIHDVVIQILEVLY
jgi:hypothetical protein